MSKTTEQGTVYLLHFDRAYKHARHYLGWTTDLEARLRRHRGEGEKDGRGSRLVEIVTAAGIGFHVARLWRGDRRLERRIKGRGLAAYCPVCSPHPRQPHGAVELPVGGLYLEPLRGFSIPHAMRATRRVPDPIAILPLGSVSPSEIRFAEETISAVFGARTQRLPSVMPSSCFDRARGQYDADRLLELLFDTLPEHAMRIVGVLDADMFAAGRTFVFGYAHLRDGVAVYSVARLREEWYGRTSDEDMLRARSYRVLVHEIGHTFDTPHCEDDGCVMHAVSRVESLDALGPSYCEPCLKRVRRGVEIAPGSAEGRFQRAGALLRRRQVPRAIRSYHEAAEKAPHEPRYHNDLGVALLADADRDGARSAFQRAADLAADFPHPYYKLGILCREAGRQRCR